MSTDVIIAVIVGVLILGGVVVSCAMYSSELSRREEDTDGES